MLYVLVMKDPPVRAREASHFLLLKYGDGSHNYSLTDKLKPTNSVCKNGHGMKNSTADSLYLRCLKICWTVPTPTWKEELFIFCHSSVPISCRNRIINLYTMVGGFTYFHHLVESPLKVTQHAA